MTTPQAPELHDEAMAKTTAKKRASQPAPKEVHASAAKPSTTPATTTIRQTFSFNAPSALSVMLVADFTHWERMPISLKREAHGLWRTDVDLAPGIYHYRFLVDGQWRDDPECTLRVPNPFGGNNSVRKVP